VTTVLAVAIGLILMYLILSLIISAVNEGLASIMDRRSGFLKKGIQNLLGSDLLKDFYNHGLIRSLTRKKARIYGKPAYVSSSTFSTVLVDVVTGSNPGGQHPRGLGEIQERAREMLDSDEKQKKELGSVLMTLAGEAVDWNDFKKRIEGWFNEAMERVSGWYKRRTRTILSILAVALVIALNADTVNVARVLWLDPTVRTAAEAAARETVRDDGAAPAPTGEDAVEAAEEAVESIRQLEKIGLPLRWSDATTPNNVPGWLLKILGLVITAFALTFGAPFWFDVLSKFVGVRASGPSPEEEGKTK
jgi:hypothetical protein